MLPESPKALMSCVMLTAPLLRSHWVSPGACSLLLCFLWDRVGSSRGWSGTRWPPMALSNPCYSTVNLNQKQAVQSRANLT